MVWSGALTVLTAVWSNHCKPCLSLYSLVAEPTLLSVHRRFVDIQV